MLKKYILIITLITLNFSICSAYIDAGTGGYLATSLWSSILAFMTIALSTIALWFKTNIKAPIKKIWEKRKVAIILFLSFTSFVSGYLFLNNKPTFDESLSGAHIYDESKLSKGVIYFDGKLINNSGEIIKEFDYKYLGIFYDGDYFAQESYESLRWGRFDALGNPIWIKEMPIHHEIIISPQKTLFVLTKEVHKYNERMVEFDVIVEFDLDGNELSRWSTWDNLEYLKTFHNKLELERPVNFILPEKDKKNTSIWGGNYDYYHLNSLKFVPKNSKEGQHPAFNEGNLIISFRHGSMIFILDRDTHEVLWRAVYNQIDENIEGQHYPQMLENGNMLIFDNGRYRQWSRIIEVDLKTLDIIWEYKDKDFYTKSQGCVQVLPNENYLITESENGRIFEITKDKKLIWEYYYPVIQNENNSMHPESFGTRQWIYRAIKYPTSVVSN